MEREPGLRQLEAVRQLADAALAAAQPAEDVEPELVTQGVEALRQEPRVEVPSRHGPEITSRNIDASSRRLRQAEEVAGIVGEHRGEAPRLLLRGALEVDAARLQRLVGGRAVAGLEGATAEDALLHQRAELRGALLVE